jgi:hypothetical protein
MSFAIYTVSNFPMKSWFFYATLLLFFFTQLPFLESDADKTIACGSRGAWTDEGLYTAPVRNFIHLGADEFRNRQSFIKTPYGIVTPLYSLYLLPFFAVLGISLLKARLVTSLTVVFLLLIAFRRKESQILGSIFIWLLMWLHPVHQYSVLCLAEIYVCLLIVCGLMFRYRLYAESPIKAILFFYFFLLAAVLYKIQYIYLLPLPFICEGIFWLRDFSRASLRKLVFSGVLLLGIGVLMFLLWYQPFKEIWRLTGSSSSAGFSLEEITPDLLLRNMDTYFLDPAYRWFSFSFLISFIVFLFLMLKNRVNHSHRILLPVLLLWMVLESHKLCLSYLPIRYMISTYTAMGLFVSLVWVEVLRGKIRAAIFALTLPTIMLLFTNVKSLYETWTSRTFHQRELIAYMSKISSPTDVVIGTWAPSVTWLNKGACYPSWAVYTQGKDILKTFHPTFIVSEPDEADTDKAFFKSKIYLRTEQDSLTQTELGLWKVNVYRIRPYAN